MPQMDFSIMQNFDGIIQFLSYVNMDKSYKYDRARIINKLFSVKKTGMVMVEQTSKGNLSFK